MVRREKREREIADMRDKMYAETDDNDDEIVRITFPKDEK